jgi:hypothetical protein
MDASWWVIINILRDKADLHSLELDRLTPLATIAWKFHMNGIWREPFMDTIWEWFNLLRKAGHDLQDYVRTECEVYPDHIYNTFHARRSCISGCSITPPYRGLERTIKIETCPESMDLLFHMRQELLTIENIVPDGHMPGSWDAAEKSCGYCSPYYVPDTIEPVQAVIRIGPRQHGIQDFQLIGDPQDLKTA